MMDQAESEVDVFALIEDELWDDIAHEFAARHPADVAEVVNTCSPDDRERLFTLVPQDAKADVLRELNDAAAEEILDILTNADAAALIESMSPDDAADVLGHMDKARYEQVLALLKREASRELRKLLRYEADTAGGIMTPDVIAMQGDRTVDEALHEIAYFDEREPFYYANIVDDQGRMLGYVNIWELLRERNRAKRLREMAHDQYAAATVDMDQEEVARLMAKYDLAVIPVVDANGILVGRVTVDDVLDVVEEEASEDIFRLAGSDEAELDGVSTLKSCALRLPWLLITLVGGFVVSLILKRFHAHIAHTLVLAAFVPIVLAMGGNTGIQSSTLMVRSLALSGGAEGRGMLRIMLREMAAGALMGCICGLAIGLWAYLISDPATTQAGLAPYHLALIVASALFAAMTFASMFGACIPLVLDKLHVDPAVASGPFITITNDISALLIYFGVTLLLTHQFAAPA